MKGQPKVKEDEVKGLVREKFFREFDCTRALGNLDFTVRDKAFNSDRTHGYYLWAESKKGGTDLIETLTQVVMTVGKERTFDKYNPPPFLGAFDSDGIMFVPYHRMADIFYQNDFNWNVRPSDHATKEFQLIYDRVKSIIESSDDWQGYCFGFARDEKEIEQFIKANFVLGKAGATKIQIDKNNFMTVYGKWLEAVRPTIQLNWGEANNVGIIDGDFYLADLLSSDNKTLKEKLFVVLEGNRYKLDRHFTSLGLETSSSADFSDGQKAHARFWAKYERPPAEQYWDYIVERRDLLVPQDVRERKGSYFTPVRWVELSQKYLADALGVDWQDDHYVWDCAAGTGNLLAGMTNKYNIWASTVDQADVDAMKDRIRNGANLLEGHVFRFDFLNGDFKDLPEGLRDIIEDPEKRKKLVVYINPPYAEASSSTTKVGTGKNKPQVSISSKIYKEFLGIAGTATREMFAQFFLRVCKELPDCRLASFSTLKYITAINFTKFRNYFKGEFIKGFVCHSKTFDNVSGNFPIGFLIWNLESRQITAEVKCDVFSNDGSLIGEKVFAPVASGNFIIDWLRKYYDKTGSMIGYLRMAGTDIQNVGGIFISNNLSDNDLKKHLYAVITKNNVIPMSIYYAVRQVIPASWLNDRDQFLYPKDGWESDARFQNDCLALALFANNIQSKFGPNHWIPFTESEVDAKDKFGSSFMSDYISGKIEPDTHGDGWVPQESGAESKGRPSFSPEAQSLFDTGKALWRHYHSEPAANPNASLYDIREHFKGRGANGRMSAKSQNETFNGLDSALRTALKALALKIEPKVYEYGFLKH